MILSDCHVGMIEKEGEDGHAFSTFSYTLTDSEESEEVGVDGTDREGLAFEVSRTTATQTTTHATARPLEAKAIGPADVLLGVRVKHLP